MNLNPSNWLLKKCCGAIPRAVSAEESAPVLNFSEKQVPRFTRNDTFWDSLNNFRRPGISPLCLISRIVLCPPIIREFPPRQGSPTL